MSDQPRYQLRPDQARTLPAIREALSEGGSVLVTAPTGFGKTVVLSEIVRRSAFKGIHTDIVVHHEELIEQSVAKIRDQTGIEPGVVWQKRREWDAPVRIISLGALASLDRLPNDVPQAPLTCLDEAHHGSAPSWKRAISILSPKWLIGFTATPFRYDREPLSPEPFRQVIRTVTPQELIDIGVLVPPLIESPVIADAQGNPQPINQAGNLPQIYVNAVRYALSQERNKIILFSSSAGQMSPNEVGAATAEQLRQLGIPASNISQNLSSRERRRATAGFDAMPTAVLISYMTLTEGFDSTSVDCVILGRQTRSESTLIQMIGRGLRSHPGKESCLVIDFTGRDDVYDIVNYWRLDGEKAETESMERGQRETTSEELDALTATFPNLVNSLAATQAQYPWFRPFPDRRLQALCLWDPERPEQGSTYVCVEPTAKRRWTVYRLNLPNDGNLVAGRVASSGMDSRAAARFVSDIIGERARLISRNAHWRRQPASQPQRRVWQRINETPPPTGLTRGDASDAIAKARFVQRVRSSLL